MDYSLKDLIDRDVFQALCEKFTRLTQTVTAILDLEGNILVATGWRDVCTQFHRVNPDTATRCKESDTTLAKRLQSDKKYTVYRCKNGLVDVAVPIIIGENHVGNIFTGQFFFESPDKEYFRQQAVKFGFDEASYLEAVSRVPIVTEEQVKLTMDYLCELAEVVGGVGLKNLELLKINEKLNREIEDKEKVEKSLLTNEAQLSNAVKIAKLGYWEYDVADDLFTFNDHFYNVFRITSEQVGGYTMSSAQYAERFIHPDDRSILQAETQKALESPDPHYSRQLEHRVIFPDGEIGSIVVRFFIVKDDQGQTIKTYGANQDITERKQAEEELYFMKSVVDKITDSAFWVVQSGRFIYVNEAACRSLGYSHEELMKMRVSDLDPNFPPEAWAGHWEDLKKRGSIKLETAHKAKDGNVFPVEVVATFMEYEGEEYNCSFVRNISERVKAEKEKKELLLQLGQAQKMEAIGTLAGGIAHDFNNILSVILGYADIAKDDAPPGTQFQKDLEKVLTAANRAKELVKQILAFSRQAHVERIPIKIQPLLKEGLKMLRSSIPTTISITEDIDPKSRPVLADPTQIHQILMNLCTNAYQSMEETGGALSVALKTTFIGADDQKMLLHVTPGEYVEFTVADTGCGIGPDVIGKIFDPYFTTKEPGKGTGMGLAIIHGIITDYGGAITVESELRKGTTFHVYFPVVEKESLSEVKSSEDIPRGNERVLFIDDEELLAQMGKIMLERLGYHVTVRHSSLEGLATFQNAPDEFDIVITDQTMPDMTGADLARQMMQIRPDVPIILCTGYSNLIDEDSAKALGIKEFVLKPLTKEVVATLIRKVLNGGV